MTRSYGGAHKQEPRAKVRAAAGSAWSCLCLLTSSSCIKYPTP